MRGRLVVLAVVAAAFGAGPAAHAAAPPGRLAFEFGPKLVVMDADGSHRQTVFSQRGAEALEPSWSPDGRRIAFADASSDTDSHRIFVMDADGSHLRRLTTEKGFAADDTRPRWSPDGTRVAYLRETDLATAVVTVDLDGRDKHVVVRRESGERENEVDDVTWTPSGKRLVFTWLRQKGRGDVDSLVSVPAAGGKEHPIARNAGFAAYSPNGARIAFERGAHLWVMRADGSAQRRLTSGAGLDMSPAWSPDGQRIAFESSRNFPAEYTFELYSIRPDGSCETWLTNGAPASGAADWQPGAGRSSDPGACGATPRPPIDDVSLGPARGLGVPVWWLGRITPDRLLLYEVYGGRGDGMYLDYTDCAEYHASDCGQPTTVATYDDCNAAVGILYGVNARRLRRIRGGGIVFLPRSKRDYSSIFTGRETIALRAHGRRRVSALAAQLRPIGARRPPHRLARPRFPRYVWRPLDRAHRAIRRTGSVRGAARLLHTSPRAIRKRVRLRHKLLHLGARRGRC